MSEIIITIKDEKDEKNNPKLGLELSYNFDLCHESSYLIPLQTLAEKIGFNIFHQIADMCHKIIQGESKNET